MQLRTKLLALVATLAGSALICNAIMYIGLGHRDAVEREVLRLQTVRLSIEKLNSLTYAIVAESRGVYMRSDLEGAKPFLDGMVKFLDEMQSTKDSLPTDEKKPDFTVISETLKEAQTFINFRRELVRIARQDSLEAAKNYGDNDSNRQVRRRLNTALRDSVAKVGSLQTEELSSMQTQNTAMIGLLFGAMAVAVAGIIGGCLLADRSFYRPINALRGAMLTLSEGQTSVDIPGTDRPDEIGEMAKAVAIFREGALANARLAREADEERARKEEAQKQYQAEQIKRAAEERDRAMAEHQRQMKEQADQAKAEERERQRTEQDRIAREKAAEDAIRSEREMVARTIGAGLTHLAAKDLTYRIDDELPPAYLGLKRDFNRAMEQLELAINRVASGSHGVTSGAGEIATATDDMSHRTERQAASLEETVATLSEISAQVAKTAEGANFATKLVATTRTKAEHGGTVIRNAVEAMNRIDTSSSQMSQIISTIDEISFQTSLLALNAGVEAARAGEAGKGFAVVASEVRALSSRSANASKEIRDLIKSSSAEVSNGVALVAQAGKALVEIEKGVSEIDHIVENLAAGAQEQSNSLSEVNTAVSQMGQLTQQNAAMVEEATAATKSLAEQANQLAELVNQFQVKKSSFRDNSGQPHRSSDGNHATIRTPARRYG